MHRQQPCALYFIIATILAVATATHPAYGLGTPAGTVIQCSSTATFTNVGSSYQGQATSNVVNITVAQKAGVSISPSASSTSSSSGRTVTFPAVVQNRGNGSDVFAISTSSPASWPATVYLDTNGDGVKQDTETTVVTTTSPVSPDGSVNLLVRVQVPPSTPVGQIGQVAVQAVSSTPEAANSLGQYSVTIINPNDNMPIYVNPGTPVLGDTIRITAQIPFAGQSPVQFSAVLPDGSSRTYTATTDQTGAATWNQFCDISGKWTVSANWAGNDDHLALSGATLITCVAPSYTVSGLDLVTIPVLMTNPSPAAASPSQQPAAFAHFLPDENRYAIYDPIAGAVSDPDLQTIEPGVGYWITSASSVTLRPAGRLVDQSQPQDIALKPGWNQVGSVYLDTTSWADASIVHSGVTYTLKQAAEQGLVYDYGWTLTKTSQGFTYTILHATLPGASTAIQPWRAFWVYSGVNTTLRLAAPVALEGQSVSGLQTQGGRSGDEPRAPRQPQSNSEWLLTLQSSGPHASDGSNFLGAGANPSVYQIANPPRPRDYEDLYFTSSEGGSVSKLASDIRASLGEESVWDFEVASSNTTGEHTLSWSGLDDLTVSYRAILTDLQTGLSSDMRQLDGYRFRVTDERTPSRFRITITRQ